MKTNVSNDALWRQVVERADEKAFESLYRGMNSRLIKFCVFYVHQREVAEEIVSDVFVKCWLDRDNLKHILKPETFLFVCVKNLALNYCKKISTIHLVNIDDQTHELVDLNSPDIKMERKELLFKLEQCIEELPFQCKVIFRLVKEDGMKCKAVAEILNISVRTVETQMFRAMKKLNSAMLKHKDNFASSLGANIQHLNIFLAFFYIFLKSL